MMYNAYDIQIASSCNSSCAHCMMKDRLDGSPVDYQKIKKVIDESPEEIHLCGGEPLIGSLQRLSSFINNYPDTSFSMTTNLQYKLTTERIGILKKIDYLMTSFDVGVGRFKSAGDISRWYHNVRALQDMGIHFCISFVMTAPFIRNVTPKRLNDFAERIGVPIHLSAFLRRPWNKDLAPSADELDTWFRLLKEMPDQGRTLIGKQFFNCIFWPHTTCIDAAGNERICFFRNTCSRHDYNCWSCRSYKKCGGRCPLILCSDEAYHIDWEKEYGKIRSRA